jgi:hypothetical protein
MMGEKKWYLSPLYLIQSFAKKVGIAASGDDKPARHVATCPDLPPPVTSLEYADLATSAQLLFDGSWITRRIESIEIIDDKWMERRTSIQVSTSEIARILSLPLNGRDLWIPIGVNRKEYYLRFDLVDAVGTSMPLAGRDIDSKFAATALCSLIEDCPEKHLEAARQLAFEMSGNADSFLSRLPKPGEKLSDFAHLLAENFCPVIRIQLDGKDKIYKMTRVETHTSSPRSDSIKDRSQESDSSGILKNETSTIKRKASELKESGKIQPKYPSISFAADFPYFGWAASEHVRVSSPEGTFFSSLYFASQEERSYQITLRDLDRASIYHRSNLPTTDGTNPNNEWPNTHRLAVTIMPSRHGGLQGTLILTWYVFLILIIAGIVGLAQYHFPSTPFSINGNSDKGIFHHLRGDPALTLGVVFPSILIGYFYVSTESRARRLMLRRWRNLATWSLGTTLFVGLSILGTPEEKTSYQYLSWISLGVGLISLLFAIQVTIWWRRVISELKRQDSLIGNSYDGSSVWVDEERKAADFAR